MLQKEQSPTLWRIKSSCKLCVIPLQGRVSVFGFSLAQRSSSSAFSPPSAVVLSLTKGAAHTKRSLPSSSPISQASFAGLMSAISSVQSAVRERAQEGQRAFQRCWEGSTARGMDETGLCPGTAPSLSPWPWSSSAVNSFCIQLKWRNPRPSYSAAANGISQALAQTGADCDPVPACGSLGCDPSRAVTTSSHFVLQIEYGPQNKCFTVSVRLKRQDMRIRLKSRKSKCSGIGERSIELLLQSVTCQSGAAFLSFPVWTWLGQGL